MAELAAVGKRTPKVDAKEKVTGRAVYACDLQMQGMLYGKIVRCWDYAHAKVKKLDLSEAAKVPGVVKVLGPKDVTQKPYCGNPLDMMGPEQASKHILRDIEDQRVFTDYVKQQGDAIAGIIAKTEEAAERAAEKVIVEYEALSVYLSADESMKPDAVQFTPEKAGNLAFQLPAELFPGHAYGWGNVDEEMKKADFIVEDTFFLPKVKQCQMEPHCQVALCDDRGRLNVWSGCQMPKYTQIKLARLFDLPMTRVKINQTIVGGAFGGRIDMVTEPQVCAMAMAVPGKAVKVEFLREEDWQCSLSRFPGKYWMKMGFKKDGTPVAVDAHWTSDSGGYYTHASGLQFTTGGWLIGMYKFGSCRYKGDTYFTNKASCGAFRGYGNPQTNFAMEQLVDRACSQLGIDPVDWRLKWHKGVGDDGWCLGVPYPSCALDACLKQGAEAIGWKEKREAYARQKGPKRRGIGVAVMNHTSGAMPMLLEHTTCTVRLNEDASAEVLLSCSDLGTGSHTALKLIAAETLEFPLDDVHLKTGDSDAAGFDIGSHASRTLYTGGGAVKAACDDAKRQLFERAAQQLEANAEDLELRDKKIYVKGSPDKSIPVREITFNGVYSFIDATTGKPNGVPGQIQGYASFFPPSNSPPFSATFVDLEVDTKTGVVKVLEAVQAFDCGRAIHPPSVEGQNEGGLQQGLGMVLTEEMLYDERGRILTSSFTDYKMFGPTDMPKIIHVLPNEPDPVGPFGGKGVGEPGCVSPVGATANAIYHALGIQFNRAPITPERILEALKAKNAETK